MIPITLIPATIVGGTLAIVMLYLKWTLHRDERRGRRS
jgi:hypothetical protein